MSSKPNSVIARTSAEGGAAASLPLLAPRPAAVAVLAAAAAWGADAPLWAAVRLGSVVHLAGREALSALLERQPVDFLLLGVEHADRRFLDALKRLRPAARLFFVAEEGDLAALLKLRERGHPFEQLPADGAAEALAAALLKGFFPREEPRTALHGYTVSFETRAGAPRQWERPLLDLSLRGVAWRIEREDDAAAFLPGSVIHGLCLRRDGVALSTPQRAVVRHLTAVPAAGEMRYTVGASLLADEAPYAEEKGFHDPLTVTALFKQALERTELLLSPLYRPERLHRGRWLAEEGGYCLGGEWPAEWQAGSVVRGTFDLNNWGCELTAVIEERAAADRIRIRLPAALKGVKRRRVPRHRLSGRAPVTVAFVAPFSCELAAVQPLDLSSEGFSFEVEAGRWPLCAGLRLDRLMIVGTREHRIDCAGELRSVAAVAGSGGRRYRCGVRFDGLGEAERGVLAELVVGDRCGVAGGQGIALEELWAFFYEAGFIYPKKEEAMRPILDQVKGNIAKLVADRDAPLLRTLVVKGERGGVAAHMSLLRAYSETWIMQHLASVGMSRGNRNAVEGVYLGTVEMLAQTQRIRWMRAYFQPQKKAPTDWRGSSVAASASRPTLH